MEKRDQSDTKINNWGSMLVLIDLEIGWPVPEYTTLCRRHKSQAIQIRYRALLAPGTCWWTALGSSRLSELDAFCACFVVQ